MSPREPEAPANEAISSIVLGVLRLIFVSVILIWLASGAIGLEWWHVTTIAPAWLAMALLVNQLALMTFAARMRLTIRTAGFRISWIAALRIHLQSMFYFFVLPMTVGLELARYVKIRALQPSGAPSALAGTLLLDRLLGAVSALSLAALTLPFVDIKVRFGASQLIVWSCAIGLVVLAAGALLWPRIREPVLKVWKLSEGHRLMLSGLFALSILMHGLFALAVHWAGRGLGLPITFADCCLAVAGGMLLVVVPISVAGLGPAEVGTAGIFMALGYEPTIAITAGALPYLLRLTGAIQGAGLELFEGGSKVFSATRRLMKRSRLPDLN